jgi:hypothetical protein
MAAPGPVRDDEAPPPAVSVAASFDRHAHAKHTTRIESAKSTPYET